MVCSLVLIVKFSILFLLIMGVSLDETKSDPVFSTVINLKSKKVPFKSLSLKISSSFERQKQKKLPKPIVTHKKRNENLCPLEYQSCWCDYTNTNLKSNNNINNNKYNLKTPHSFSIMIDCQFYLNSEYEKFQNVSSSSLPASENSILKAIPRISTSGPSAKFKYLQHIIHLDLSRTAISEVPTDAFHGLSGLQTIVITNCKNLVRIKMFAFRNLPNLKTLIIANNPNLIELEPHALGSLKNLNYLSLSMNQLSAIDGYIFSSSSSIKIIDFIGNPINRIKSHAFHGLRNVSDLLLSLNQNVSPIEVIEGDSFISIAFVDQIFLQGIPARALPTNAFRGLSYCKNLQLSNSNIEEIEANAFYRANNIEKINLQNSKVKKLHTDSFRGMFNIETIDLRGNYISKLNKSTFEPLIVNNINVTQHNFINSSITLIDHNKNNKYIVKKLLFEQNPIQCDCNLVWVLRNKIYLNYIGLPEICAGPEGFDCLRISELNEEKLACSTLNSNVSNLDLPCVAVVFDIDQNQLEKDILSIAASNGINKNEYQKEDEDDESNNEEEESFDLNHENSNETNDYQNQDSSNLKLDNNLAYENSIFLNNNDLIINNNLENNNMHSSNIKYNGLDKLQIYDLSNSKKLSSFKPKSTTKILTEMINLQVTKVLTPDKRKFFNHSNNFNASSSSVESKKTDRYHSNNNTKTNNMVNNGAGSLLFTNLNYSKKYSIVSIKNHMGITGIYLFVNLFFLTLFK